MRRANTNPAVVRWIEEYLVLKTAEGKSPSTLRAYRQRLYRFRDWLGNHAITRDNCIAYLASLQEDPDLTDITVSGYMRDVNVFARWLVKEGRLKQNPAANLTPTIPSRIPASYSIEQLRQLLGVCKLRDKAIVLFLIDTGLRASELVGSAVPRSKLKGIRREDINFATGEFRVIGKRNKERAGWLEPYTLGHLEAYLATREDDHPALFVGVAGALTYTGLYQMIARRVRDAGLEGEVRRLVHSFRSSFAQLYIENGGDLGTLADLGGWADLTMPKHYSKLAKGSLARKKHEINPLSAVIGSEKEQEQAMPMTDDDRRRRQRQEFDAQRLFGRWQAIRDQPENTRLARELLAHVQALRDAPRLPLDLCVALDSLRAEIEASGAVAPVPEPPVIPDGILHPVSHAIAEGDQQFPDTNLDARLAEVEALRTTIWIQATALRELRIEATRRLERFGYHIVRAFDAPDLFEVSLAQVSERMTARSLILFAARVVSGYVPDPLD